MLIHFLLEKHLKRKINLVEDPIAPTIIKMAFGMLFGILAMSAYNAADTYFVGQLGTLELAAMGFTFPVVMILNSISLGLGIGLSSTVSRAIGSNNYHKVQKLTFDGLFLSLLIVIILGLVGVFTIRPLFSLLGASETTLGFIHQYMIIWYIGLPFVVIPMAGNNVIRATGDTLTPSMVMIVSVVVNIILDPLLIFGIGPFPHMGIAGAALATVIARFTTFLVSLYILIFRDNLLVFKRIRWKAMVESWKEIAFVGVPAALVQAITPLSLAVVTHLLAQFGEAVVAGYGAATRIEMLILIIPNSLASVMAPFAGQNWGAHKSYRILKAAKISSLISLGWGLCMFIVLIFLSQPIVSLFSNDPSIIHSGALYLQIVSISYGFLGMLLIASQSFNGINRPLHSATVSLIKAFIVNIPFAIIGATLYQETGIFTATMLTNLIGGTIGMIVLISVLKKSELLMGKS